MSEQEGSVIDPEKQLTEATANDDSKAFAPNNEQSPSIAELVKRKIHSAFRSIMPPKR